MKTTTRRLLAVLLAATLLLCLCACGDRYRAAVYSDQATELIRVDFAADHLTSGIYLEGADTVTDADDYPRTRAFIVDTQAAYDEIFTDYAPAVNFETEMLILCTYTSNYVHPVEIVKVKQEGSTLSVTLREKRKSDFFFAFAVGAACAPYQRYVIIKLDKLDVTSVDLTIKS